MKFLIPLLLCVSVVHADEIVFRGLPLVRLIATPAHDNREKLDADAAQKSECLVVLRGRKFYWRSRNDVLLNKVETSDFTYFISPEGFGFIKVFTGQRKADAAAEYIESITREFDVITYWGKVTSTR